MHNPTQDEIHQFQMALRQSIDKVAQEHKALLTQHFYNTDDREGSLPAVGITAIFRMQPRKEDMHDG